MAEERFVIQNEDDAWELLEQLCEGELSVSAAGHAVSLAGWPKLQIYIPQTAIKGAITPSMMAELVEVQAAIYRAYSILRHNTADTRHLGRHEREALEFSVVVRAGSSSYDIDLQAIINQIIDHVSDKMDPLHITIAILGIALLYFGHGALSKYLDHRLEKRKEDNRSAEARATLEHLRFSSDKETERMRLMADAIARVPKLGPVMEESEDVHAALLKSAAKSNGAVVQGIQLNGSTASELATNARRTGEDVTISGTFHILRVDTTHPDGFLVRLRNKETGEVFLAGVQDIFLSEDHRKIIQAAEWRKQAVECKLDARRVGGTITRAVIIDAKDLEESASDHL